MVSVLALQTVTRHNVLLCVVSAATRIQKVHDNRIFLLDVHNCALHEALLHLLVLQEHLIAHLHIRVVRSVLDLEIRLIVAMTNHHGATWVISGFTDVSDTSGTRDMDYCRHLLNGSLFDAGDTRNESSADLVTDVALPSGVLVELAVLQTVFFAEFWHFERLGALTDCGFHITPCGAVWSVEGGASVE